MPCIQPPYLIREATRTVVFFARVAVLVAVVGVAGLLEAHAGPVDVVASLRKTTVASGHRSEHAVYMGF